MFALAWLLSTTPTPLAPTEGGAAANRTRFDVVLRGDDGRPVVGATARIEGGDASTTAVSDAAGRLTLCVHWSRSFMATLVVAADGRRSESGLGIVYRPEASRAFDVGIPDGSAPTRRRPAAVALPPDLSLWIWHRACGRCTERSFGLRVDGNVVHAGPPVPVRGVPAHRRRRQHRLLGRLHAARDYTAGVGASAGTTVIVYRWAEETFVYRHFESDDRTPAQVRRAERRLLRTMRERRGHR